MVFSCALLCYTKLNIITVLTCRFIADGDSSVHKQIRERVSYGTLVSKVECTNHLVKNIGKHLYKLADANAIYRKLLKNKVQSIGKFTRWLISVNASQKSPSVSALKSDLGNITLHAFGDHTSCRKAVCYEAGSLDVESLNLKAAPTDFQIKFQAIMSGLTSHATSLIENDTSNLAESYMHLVAKFTGGKQCFYGGRGSYLWRTYAAGLAFQHGPDWHQKAWKKKVGHSPGIVMKSLIHKRNRNKAAAKR